MNSRFHGVTSLLLESLAVVIGFTAVWQAHQVAGMIYAVLILAAAPLILYAYCAKCDIRTTGCRHVLPGQLTRLLPARDEGPYRISDYAGLVLPAAVIVLFPQPWLRDNLMLLILFWLCLVGGVVQILVKVCKGCGNEKCMMPRLRN